MVGASSKAPPGLGIARFSRGTRHRQLDKNPAEEGIESCLSGSTEAAGQKVILSFCQMLFFPDLRSLRS